MTRREGECQAGYSSDENMSLSKTIAAKVL
jgi:hypothetical protein